MNKLTEPQKAALIAGIIGLAVGIGIGTSLPWYGSLEECILREAKGLPRGSLELAEYYCYEKFP